MKLLSYCTILLAAIITLSCGGGSVSNVQSSTTSSYSGLQGNDYLVIARVGANDVRQAYENALVSALEAQGVKATSSYAAFPNVDITKQYSAADVQSFTQQIESQGYDGVIVSVVRGKHKETDTYPVGGDDDFYGAYPGYYYGFGGYYMAPMAYPDFGPTEYNTQTYDVYTLNTNVYDLELPPSKQLVAVVSNDLTDPNNLLNDSQEYAEKVVKSLEKQK